MKVLNPFELKQVSGGDLFYDIGYAIGDAIGGVIWQRKGIFRGRIVLR